MTTGIEGEAVCSLSSDWSVLMRSPMNARTFADSIALSIS